MSLEHSPGRRLLRTQEVMHRMGWSRTTLWRRVRAGNFAAPVRTGPNSIAFYEDEVDAAQANLPRVCYAPAPEAGRKSSKTPCDVPMREHQRWSQQHLGRGPQR